MALPDDHRIIWDSPVDLTVTGLASLGSNFWWQSGIILDPNPTNQFVSISWQVAFGSTPAAGNYLWFKLARSDEAAADKIWDGNIGESEGVVGAGTDSIAVEQAPIPKWTHQWVSGHGTVMKSLRIVTGHMPEWQLLLSPRGTALAPSGHFIRYRYGRYRTVD